MSNPFKAEFILKQHTPMIHFQSDQTGATLRATELKPKLDRFLIERVFGGEVPSKYLFTKEKDALDYKVAINPESEINIFEVAPIYKHYNFRKKETEKKPLGFPTFFASIGKEWKQKSQKIKFSSVESLTLTIKTFHTDLKKAIEDNIALFFFMNNFGMRQSKGFGSFLVENGDIPDNIVDSYYFLDVNINSLNQLSYSDPNRKGVQKFNKEIHSNFVDTVTEEYKNNFMLFKTIDLFYKTLRSGVNFNKFYFKSLMFLYAKEKLNVRWDKRIFKSKFISSKYYKEQLKKHSRSNCKDVLSYDTNDLYLLRDCLGLSTIQEYNYSREYRDSEKFTIRHPNTDHAKKDSYNNKDIEPNEMTRFQSPLMFKPIKIREKIYRVYIIPKSYPNNIFEQEITVLKVKNNHVENKIDNLKFYPNFDLKAYLDFAFSTNIKNNIENCGTNSKLLESQLLISIYNSLNRQHRDKGANQ